MRALVLGARGAVGRAAVDRLRAGGHGVLAAGRGDGVDERIDLRAPGGLAGLARVAAGVDVVLNASGVEDPALAGAVGGAALVDVSATAGYLARLDAAAPPAARLVRGAGLAPGLTTVLVDALDARAGDDIDVAVLLGSGEAHGPAAVAWTAGLAGAALFRPAEGGRVLNFRQARRFAEARGGRRYLRADFPDHLLAGGSLRVRSWLAVTSRASTAALGVVGWVPALRGAIARAPHLGSDAWRVAARNRRTGKEHSVTGAGQSAATGILAAVAAERAAGLPAGARVTSADLMTLDEAVQALGASPSRRAVSPPSSRAGGR